MAPPSPVNRPTWPQHSRRYRELLEKRISAKNIEIISVFNHPDIEFPFEVHQKIPYKTFDIDNFIPNFEKDYVIICKKGITSYEVTLKIKEKYPSLNVFSLFEGINSY